MVRCTICRRSCTVPTEMDVGRRVCRRCRSQQRAALRRPGTAAPTRGAGPLPAEQSLDGNTQVLRDAPRAQPRTPEEYLTEIGMSLEVLKADGDSEFVVTHQRLNEWGSNLGDGTVGVLYQVELRLVRRQPLAVTMPALSACRVVIPAPKPAPTRGRATVEKAVVLPDIQIGFRRDLRTGKLLEFHNREAIDVALQIIADVNPDRVVLLGDNLDLPDFSDKFVRTPEMYFTSEPSCREYTWILGRIRALAPRARIICHLGNHEARVAKAAATYMMGTGGLTNPAGGEWILSIQSMIDPENRLALEWLEYPDGEHWLNPNLRTIHGTIAASAPGATARKYLQTARCSTIFGHIHRRESLAVTHHFSGGQRTYYAESAGCLCHTDGRVPGSGRDENWQNGLHVVEYEVGSEEALYTIGYVPIYRDRAIWNGHRYQGAYDLQALIEATGWEAYGR